MNRPNQRSPYWFTAKTYGYGWGMPACWEGWVVLGVWVAIIALLSPVLATRSMPAFIIFMAVMVATLIAICYVKGEPLRWRWGKSGGRSDE